MKDENLIWIIIISIFVMFFLGGFGGMMGWGHMPFMYESGYLGMWSFMWMIWLLLIIFLILGIIWLAKQIQKK